MEKVRVAVIGLGSRGSMMTDFLTGIDTCGIVAVCDVYSDRTDAAKKLVLEKTGREPSGTSDYKELLCRNDIDAVLIMTSWESHVQIAIDAMTAGIPVGMEVGGAYTLDDCFRLVRVQEETGCRFMFLENCCYGRYELLTLNMVKKGLFGDIVHCEGGYHHDLRREVLFGEENRHYRLRNYLIRNCENYPSHELGPIAEILNINHGNRMTMLTSMSSASRGLNACAMNDPKVNPKFRTAKFAQGDVVVTNIMCADGATITLTLDTSLPRAYSRGYIVRGTLGMYEESNNSVYLEADLGGKEYWDWSPEWNNATRYLEKYEHPIWDRFLHDGVRGGHGGMDYLVYTKFFRTIIDNTPSPIDVYDAAAWMAVTPLSEQSIKNGSSPVEFPDFTNGKWQSSPAPQL